MGGVNPQDGFSNEIDVDFGDEYITNLAFNPSSVTLAIPEPQSALLALSGLLFSFLLRRRVINS